MAKTRTLADDRLNEALHPRFDAYQQLITRIHEAVDQLIPVESTVLVVSKGDPALLALGQRSGWHFPRAADGQYAGFHPADSDDAIGRLEAQRDLGARYLVIPSTSAWWYEQYPEFISHLRTCGRELIEDPSLGSIFELAPKTLPPSPVVKAEVSAQSNQQLLDLLEVILPGSATIAVITARNDDLATQSRLRTVVLRYVDDLRVDENEAIRDLRELAGGTADFLVVPSSCNEWLSDQRIFARFITKSYPLVTDQRNVCKIYDLASQGKVRT